MGASVISIRVSEKLLKEIEEYRKNETEFEHLSAFTRALFRRELRRGKERHKRRVEDKIII